MISQVPIWSSKVEDILPNRKVPEMRTTMIVKMNLSMDMDLLNVFPLFRWTGDDRFTHTGVRGYPHRIVEAIVEATSILTWLRPRNQIEVHCSSGNHPDFWHPKARNLPRQHRSSFIESDRLSSSDDSDDGLSRNENDLLSVRAAEPRLKRKRSSRETRSDYLDSEDSHRSYRRLVEVRRPKTRKKVTKASSWFESLTIGISPRVLRPTLAYGTGTITLLPR